MGIILKHIFKNIREKKMRSLIIIFSLIIVSMIATICISMKDEIGEKYAETLRSILGKSDMIIVPTDEDIKISDIKIENDKVNMFTDLSSPIALKYKDDYKYVLLDGLEIEKAVESNLLKHNNVSNLKNDELIISKKTAEIFEYNVGDTVTLYLEDGSQKELKIAYIIENKRLLSSESNVYYFITTKETASNILKVEVDNFSDIYIDVKDDSNISDVYNKIKEDNKDLKIKVEKIVDEEMLEEATQSILQLFSIIFIIVFIMIFFVITGISKLIINERIPVIGTFRSIGATKRKMNLILILENVVYGIIGGTIGAILGGLLKNNISNIFFTTGEGIELASTKAFVESKYIVAVIIFTIILQLIMSISAIIKTSRKPIKDIIFNKQDEKYKKSKVKIVIGLVSIIIATVLYSQNNDSEFSKSIMALVLIILGIALEVPLILSIFSAILKQIGKILKMPVFELASSNISNSKTVVNSSEIITITMSLMIIVYVFSTSFLVLFNGIEKVFTTDCLVQNLSKEKSEYEYIKDIEGVKDISYLYAEWTNKKINGEEASFNMLPNNDPDKIFEFFDGIEVDKEEYKNLKENEIILDDQVLKRYKLAIGDTVKFEISNGDNTYTKQVEFKIVGRCDSTYYNSSRQCGIINFEKYKDLFGNIPYFILVKTDLDAEKMASILKDKVSDFGVTVQTVEDYIDEQKQANMSLLSMIFILIGIGIVNNQIIGYIQRRRELAVLYSTAMSKKQLKRLILIETFLSFGIAIITATGIGYVLSKILEQLLNGMYLSMKLEYNFADISKLVIGVLIIMLLTTINPRRKIKKMNVVDEIKYE